MIFSTCSCVMNLTGSQSSKYRFRISTSSFLAVSLNSLIIVIILSSTACIVRLISVRSVCSDFISIIAFLWLLSMFCSITSSFLRSSLYLSSPILTLAAIVFSCSVIPLVSGAGGGVFGPNSPLAAGAGASGIIMVSSGMLNVYIVLNFNYA